MFPCEGLPVWRCVLCAAPLQCRPPGWCLSFGWCLQEGEQTWGCRGALQVEGCSWVCLPPSPLFSFQEGRLSRVLLEEPQSSNWLPKHGHLLPFHCVCMLCKSAQLQSFPCDVMCSCSLITFLLYECSIV